MSTMYIAANNCTERGYFIGDVVVLVKAANLFLESEQPDKVILSLHRTDPWNFLWRRFTHDKDVTVIWDDWDKGNQDEQYRQWGERMESRTVRGIPFDSYKELYPRLDGGDRQRILAGGEAGLGRRNIFEYYFFGQQEVGTLPESSQWLKPGLVDWLPDRKWRRHNAVFVSPHEKCQGNAHFTHRFWEQVILRLIGQGIPVTVNDPGTEFMAGYDHGLFQRTYAPPEALFEQVAHHALVLTGNTGTGWVSACTGTPMVAGEKNMILCEYSFDKCGCDTLKHLLVEPNVNEAVEAALEVYRPAKVKLVWMPTWKCSMYGTGSCPYCPYGYKDGHLTLGGVQTSPDGELASQRVAQWFTRNGSAMGYHLEISGGEPLMYKDLPDVLERLGESWTFAITSNTLTTSVLDAIIDRIPMTRCAAWTASYHPMADKDAQYAANVEKLMRAGPRYLAATICVSDATLPHLRDKERWLRGLGIRTINWHLDTHCDHAGDIYEQAQAQMPGLHVQAGQRRRDVLCRRNENLLCLGPGGVLYSCVTGAYTDTHRIGTMDDVPEIADLERGNVVCPDDCFACCDFIKHQ